MIGISFKACECTAFIKCMKMKVGCPLNGVWSKNMSSITYQKSPKIRVGDVYKKDRFFRALCCAAWKRGCMYCLLCCLSVKPRAAWTSILLRLREFIVFSSQVSPFMYLFNQIIILYKFLSQKTRKTCTKCPLLLVI